MIGQMPAFGLFEWLGADEIKKETLSVTGFHAVRRILKAVQASRKDNYKSKRQIQRTLNGKT